MDMLRTPPNQFLLFQPAYIAILLQVCLTWRRQSLSYDYHWILTSPYGNQEEHQFQSAGGNTYFHPSRFITSLVVSLSTGNFTCNVIWIHSLCVFFQLHL
jgi:hypothetical protein